MTSASWVNLSKESCPRLAPEAYWGPSMKFFLGLQVADAITTLIFLSMGQAESNPIVSYLIEVFGPVWGVLLLKGLALGVALLCRLAASPKFFRRINMVYVAIVTMNVLTILTAHRS